MFALVQISKSALSKFLVMFALDQISKSALVQNFGDRMHTLAQIRMHGLVQI